MSEGLTYSDFSLPPTVVSRVDLSRLVDEAERIEASLTTATVRAKAGAAAPTMPSLSESLRDFLQQNKLSLTSVQQWGQLIRQLRLLKDKAPVVHLTFATVADRDSLQQLAAWVRTSVHPQAVITAGLQPALIGGVYVRTPNHVHDLSMRGLLRSGHDGLVKELEALRGSK